MSVTEKEAFTLGFLTRCAEEGLTGEALTARLESVAKFNEKTAQNPVVKFSPLDLGPGQVASGIGSGASKLIDYGLAVAALPIMGSIIGGSGLGYGAAKMVEPQINEDEIKAKELAATYKLYADKAKNRKKVRQYRLGHGGL
jgi:hypothetical protein